MSHKVTANCWVRKGQPGRNRPVTGGEYLFTCSGAPTWCFPAGTGVTYRVAWARFLQNIQTSKNACWAQCRVAVHRMPPEPVCRVPGYVPKKDPL